MHTLRWTSTLQLRCRSLCIVRVGDNDQVLITMFISDVCSRCVVWNLCRSVRGMFLNELWYRFSLLTLGIKANTVCIFPKMSNYSNMWPCFMALCWNIMWTSIYYYYNYFILCSLGGYFREYFHYMLYLRGIYFAISTVGQDLAYKMRSSLKSYIYIYIMPSHRLNQPVFT